ncbi:MAG TPA: hypothetical protein VKZ53_29095, partial [Candidatus Angelobacter sp.]|nr:hypothetical protein [Candidatus Angelobacter sp.]
SLSNGVSVSDSFVWQQIAYLDPDRGRTRENKSIQSTDALMLGCIFALFLALVVLAILPFAFSA